MTLRRDGGEFQSSGGRQDENGAVEEIRHSLGRGIVILDIEDGLDDDYLS